MDKVKTPRIRRPRQTPAQRLKVKEIDFDEVFAEYEKGDKKLYMTLMEKLSGPGTSVMELTHILTQLKGCVSRLTNDHEGLVRAILRVDWLQRDAKFRGHYQALLVNLVSAQPIFLTRVLATLVRHFSPQNPSPPCALEDVDPAHHREQEKNFSMVHSVLQELAKIIPLLPKHLQKESVLSENLPHSRHSTYVQVWYVKNLLLVSRYLPELSQHVLGIIVHRLLELDVSLPKEDIWESDDMEMSSDAPQFAMDGVEDNDGNEKKNPILSETGAKLDALMAVTLAHLKETCFRNGEFLLEEAKVMHHHLLQVFEKVILPTYASHHVQFIFFYFCSFRQGIVDSFVDALWKKFINPNTPSIVRQTIASYLASFVARADYLPHSTVTACLDLIVGWIQGYIDNQEGVSRFNQDISVHKPFYSLCQALLYIFVYRHKQLLENNQGLQYVMTLNLERIVKCRLNPLKVCLPSIVGIFAALARKFQVAFCYTVMEHNARTKLPIFKLNSASSASTVVHSNPLDSFFPFDPYLLPRSGEEIGRMYRHWEGCKPDFPCNPETGNADDEDEEDEFMLYETIDKDLPLGLTPTSVACVSPGFRTPSSHGR